MIFGFIELLFLFAVASRPFYDYNIEENYIDNFVVAFHDSKALDSWLKLQNFKDTAIRDSLKKMIEEIGNIVSEINSDKSKTFKDLIINTNMIINTDRKQIYDIDLIGFESYAIIRSVVRILANNENDKKKKNRKFYKSSSSAKYILGNDIIFNELDLIYLDICKACLQILESPKTNESNDSNNENTSVLQDWPEEILPTMEKVCVHVLASSKEISLSRKSLHNSINLYMRNEYTLFSPNVQHKYNLPKIETDKNEEQKKLSLKFKHKKSSAKLLLLLIHINSVLNSKEIIYSIEKLDNDFYEIECSTPVIPSLQDIKEQYLKKDFKDFAKIKLYNTFTLLDGSTDSYSLINDDETENMPIDVRLMVLSCGHLLGLSLIDDFFEYCYRNPDKDLECQLCRIPIEILGCFDSIVYKKMILE